MVALEWGNIKIEWWNADEGFSGDYNSEDPDDVNLLRFDVMRFEEVVYSDVDGEQVSMDWVHVDDASYCTMVPADTDSTMLTLLALFIMEKIYVEANAGLSIKKECERLSWIRPDWLSGTAE